MAGSRRTQQLDMPLLGATDLYPRLRFMGSKYKIVPHLRQAFSCLEFDTVLDAFSGSGVVSYTLKQMGKQVTSNDFLQFPATVARALIENPQDTLDPKDVTAILAPNADGETLSRAPSRDATSRRKIMPFSMQPGRISNGSPVIKKIGSCSL